MGLLYVSGVVLHDEAQEAIDRRARAERRRAYLLQQFAEQGYRRTEVARSLSDEVREAARVRAAIPVN